MNLTTVTASVRDGRFGHQVAAWVNQRIGQRPHIEPAVLDLAETPLPLSLPEAKDPEVQLLEKRLDWSDAFVIVTPEYNHGYPAALKNLIDTFTTPWRAKPFAFVCYGGQAGGLRAVEQLRPVVSELHGVPIRDAVSINDPWSRLAADGTFAPGDRADRSLAVMLDRLAWWAEALRTARERRPYDA